MNPSIFFTNIEQQIPHMVFVGRWCPLHKGHTWIIEEKRKEYPDKPILILVRDTSFDLFPATERAEVVKRWFLAENIKGTIMIIPDIEGIYYGRGVGYNVEEIQPPENIKIISSTEIRKRIADNDDSWKDLVANGTQDYLKEILNGYIP